MSERVTPEETESGEDFKAVLQSLQTHRPRDRAAEVAPGNDPLDNLGHGGSHPPRLLGLICADESGPAEERLGTLEEYCQKKGYELLSVVLDDRTRPGSGLHQAMELMAEADGLIVCHLWELSSREKDRMNEIRPLVRDNFLHQEKVLVVIEEGIDTDNVEGQSRLLEVLNRL